jgi:hypothetical protein
LTDHKFRDLCQDRRDGRLARRAARSAALFHFCGTDREPPFARTHWRMKRAGAGTGYPPGVLTIRETDPSGSS